MGLEELTGKEVFLDTSLIIYYLEANPDYLKFVEPLFSDSSVNGIELHASTIAMTETLVKPYATGTEFEIGLINDFFEESYINLHSFNKGIASEAAQIKADYGFKLPDAIHLATAQYHSADIFLTNDKQLKRCKGVQVELISDLG